MGIYYIEQVYLMPYVYSFCQIFQALRLFPTLRLLGTLEYLFECRKNDVIDSFDKFNNPDWCPDDPILRLVYPVYMYVLW